MKTLLILRHAKAEPARDGEFDVQRALAPRGIQDAARIGRLLRDRSLVPDVILSSAAVRAKTTTDLVMAAMQFAGRAHYLDQLYMAPPQTYLKILAREGGDARQALLVGHNPSLDELLYLLTSEETAFPTAGLAVVELDIAAWEEIRPPARYRLASFYRPKEL